MGLQKKLNYKKTESERSFYRGSNLKQVMGEDIVSKFDYIGPIRWIFLNYCTGYFIFVEELTNNSEIRSDRLEFIDTMNKIFSEAEQYFNSAPKERPKNPKSLAEYKYLGYYRLSFSNTNPDNSAIIRLNDVEVEKSELPPLLNLDTDEILDYAV
ncbi:MULTISPECIES: hypothetical protein [Archaeoglobus]|uniref:Uncharacterized protein AF_1407 n=2 Tax=Archaeoglobus fulgidus TaxID=2234 RepID=Y1407_ARCFU|nr:MULTISPECIES: hypothetical protein [Archaeoglobus]O28865.1 RecName: Full=Uncharacterized protein AF_1407 [Archaeoglobus fulgidus DSM 4304]AAB89848.1 predicted coding region AF_1407 [Archaeoglobus fulgidus DSM 4304]AIG98286.1 hypothetical protein AFULGI_00015190 [Archaeoglobus fulgidus DSM 8774]MDI3497348.1 hypothetical protein [Archaeoglobus sp.]